jgi:hypothetical protein
MYERCSIDVKIGLKRALTSNKQDVPLLGLNNKQNNLTTPLFIVMVMLLASLSPLAMATPTPARNLSEISYGI